MPSYKKFVLNGDNVSDLTNDSNFLTTVPNHSASLVTSGTFTTARIPNLSASKITSGTFATARIADSAITGAKLATGAVDHPSKLATGVVGATAIDSSAVGASELNVVGNGTNSQFLRSDGDGSFSWASIMNTNTTYTLDITENNPDVIIGLNPSSGSTQYWTLEGSDGIDINTDESSRTSSFSIQPGTITGSMIDNGAVSSAKIANGAVTGNQLQTYAVSSSSKLNSNVVTESKINSNAVTPSKANLGWHTQTKIFVPPSDFMVNDDQNYGNLALMDNGGQAKVMYAVHEAYANVPIPSGYKVTHWRVNGTGSITVSLNYSTIATSTTISCQAPAQQYTNTTNVTNPTSGITADDTNGRYIVIGWFPGNTSTYLYGAVLTIAKI